MSNNVNDEWMERASEMMEYWQGTALSEIIKSDMANNDLSALRYHVLMAEADASRDEFYSNDAF